MAIVTSLDKSSKRAGVRESFDPFTNIPAGQAGNLSATIGVTRGSQPDTGSHVYVTTFGCAFRPHRESLSNVPCVCGD